VFVRFDEWMDVGDGYCYGRILSILSGASVDRLGRLNRLDGLDRLGGVGLF